MPQSEYETSLPGRLEDELFKSLGENDSIVDRLLELPLPDTRSCDPVDQGLARRMEQVLAQRMRQRIQSHK
jgi:hypothetical protein